MDIEERRKEIYNAMSAREKLNIASDLYFSALALKQAHLKRLHPEWPEEAVEQKAKEWMLYART
jgi:hypothetical protein